MITRRGISERVIDQAFDEQKEHLERRLEQHGPGEYASTHESLGIVTEEYYELIDAVKANDSEAVVKELQDIATACLVGIATYYNVNQNWETR